MVDLIDYSFIKFYSMKKGFNINNYLNHTQRDVVGNR